jgi:hypothetical protein
MIKKIEKDKEREQIKSQVNKAKDAWDDNSATVDNPELNQTE